MKNTSRRRIIGILLLALIMTMLYACKTSEEPEVINEIHDSVIGLVPMHADYPVYETEKECVEKADLVFSGIIESMSFEMLDIKESNGKDPLTGLEKSSPIPYTLYTIKIDEMYKGKSDTEEIVVKCIGGKSEETIYQSDFLEKLKEGSSYLFLVSTYENTYPSPINPEQGVIELSGEKNEFAKSIIKECNGCAHESEEDTSVTSSIDYDAMDALEGVQLSIEEGTLSSTGATFILYNGSDYDIRLYPEPEKTAFHVFKDSEWVNVKDETYNMTLRVLKISPSTEWKIEAPWGNRLGELPEGKYRYVRCFTSRGKEYCVTCEFEL